MPLNRPIDSEISQIDALIPISEVERQTGIPQATLRMWERRYGFPRPLRDPHGNRVYPYAQVERLRLVRRLLDQGLRPSKILNGNADLEVLAAQSELEQAAGMLNEYSEVFELIQRYRTQELHAHLHFQLLDLGLSRFVIDVLAPLTVAVGLAWQYGRLPVRSEHFYSEQVSSLLHHAMAAPCPGNGSPRVILATLSQETHTLGLLMAEAVLKARGADCIRLGSNLPLAELINGAKEADADVVALSFSASFPRKHLLQSLAELRTGLPAHIATWVGGQGVQHLSHAPTDVTVLTSLEAIEEAILAWRQQRSEAA